MGKSKRTRQRKEDAEKIGSAIDGSLDGTRGKYAAIGDGKAQLRFDHEDHSHNFHRQLGSGAGLGHRRAHCVTNTQMQMSGIRSIRRSEELDRKGVRKNSKWSGM